MTTRMVSTQGPRLFGIVGRTSRSGRALNRFMSYTSLRCQKCWVMPVTTSGREQIVSVNMRGIRVAPLGLLTP